MIAWRIFNELSIPEALPKNTEVWYLETICFFSMLQYLISTYNYFLFWFVGVPSNIAVYPVPQFLISFTVSSSIHGLSPSDATQEAFDRHGWNWYFQEASAWIVCQYCHMMLGNNQTQQLSDPECFCRVDLINFIFF